MTRSFTSAEKTRMAGAYVPRSLADHLGLVAVLKGTTQSDIVRKALETHLSQEEPPDAIINRLAEIALEGWTGKGPFYKYEADVRANLRRRKVARRHIESISERMRELREVRTNQEARAKALHPTPAKGR
jgi:Arc/MetJ-type ribon-helix-helix transcriptional regulator